MAHTYAFAVYLGFVALSLQAVLSTPVGIDESLTAWPNFYFPLAQNANSSALFPVANCNGLELEEATIDQLQDAMSQGKLTAVQLAMCYLQRVYQVDKYIK